MDILIDKPAIFTAKLQKWYKIEHRKLPWRETNDPYKIWLSEVILQQTRVAQGLSYYHKFTNNYPTIKDLAEADEQSILKDWQGLGYYSRARNMHQAAKTIQLEHKGVFPSDYKSIRNLKGVGDYTAAAIASFAFQQKHAVLDGNVFRVLSRIFGIETPIDSSLGKKQFQEKANQLLDKNNPAKHNQAIMEFGALQCVPKNPNCTSCIFNSNCVANATDSQQDLPIKSNKTKQRKRYFNYLIFEFEDEILLNKRTEKEIWQNLHDFPLVESKLKISSQKLLKLDEFEQITNAANFELTSTSKARKHILSHQIILANFYHFRIADKSQLNKSKWEWINKNELGEYPIPKLIENYLKEETNLLSLFH